MCRSSSGSEIYDLAWSPCGTYFVTGSMDNVARIYKAENGRSIAIRFQESVTDEEQAPAFDK